MNLIRKTISLFAAGALLCAIACNYTSTDERGLTPDGFRQPASQPLKFSKEKKIDWNKIPTVNMVPVFHDFSLGKLPIQHYDSTDLKPFSNAVKQSAFDISKAPAKSFDLDAQVSDSIKFKSFILRPPVVSTTEELPEKNAALSLYSFGEAQGLDGTAITFLYKDNDGFLWIATYDALYRYDGKNLLSYMDGPFDHYINGIAQDAAGRIWLSQFNGGIQVLDIKNGILEKPVDAEETGGDRVSSTFMDKRQRLWVTYYSGRVGVIDTHTDHIGFLGAQQGISGATMSVAQDGSGDIWIASRGGGLTCYDFVNDELRHFHKPDGLQSDSLIRLAFDEKTGDMCISYDDGTLNIFNPGQKTIQTINEIQLSQHYLVSLFPDSQGRLWVGTGEGAYMLDLKKHLIRSVKVSDGLSGRFIQIITEGNKGQLWIGSSIGLDVINGRKSPIEHLGTGKTSTAYEDKDGLIWQGTTAGINIIDRKFKTIRHLGKEQGLCNDTVQSIREIQDGIFICTNNGIDIIDPGKTFIMHLGTEQGFTNKEILSATADKSGKVWLGGDQDGVDMYDLQRQTLKHIGKARGLSDGFKIDALAADPQGRIWVGTRLGGVDVIDPAAQTIKYLNIADGTKELVADDKGNVWIGSTKGIYIADQGENKLLHLSTSQGLISDNVLSMLKYKGKIYAGTNKGITEITPPAGALSKSAGWKVRSFGESYGIVKTILENTLSDLITRDGRYGWGDAGISLLTIPQDTAAAPPVFISSINIMDEPQSFINKQHYLLSGKDTLWDDNDVFYTHNQTPQNTGYALGSAIKWDGAEGPYNLPVKLQLRYNQNFIQFHFNVLNLARHDTTRYRYKLVGFDDRWNQVANSNSSKNYFSVSPGEYTFEVSGRTMEGKWSVPAKFSFVIHPPWWKTWWAYILYIALAAGFVWAFGYYRSMQLVKDNRVLENKIKQRTEEVLQQKEEMEAQRDHLEKVVDELKVTQTQLVQGEKLASLGELTAGIAHEIQNPLNFVNNFSEVSVDLLKELEEAQAKPERDLDLEKDLFADLEQNLEKISQHGKRAEGIVKTMLQYSRNNNNEREEVDVNALAEEYLRLAYHGLRAKDKEFNATITSDLYNRLPKLKVVPHEIGRVLINIFNNGFYAVRQKAKQNPASYQPKVTLKTYLEDKQVKISIRDNGTGIPDNIRDKILQPFFTTKPTGEGTGLGLSLSYDIVVKGYGGNISIDSKPGEYTEFIVSLPV